MAFNCFLLAPSVFSVLKYQVFKRVYFSVEFLKIYFLRKYTFYICYHLLSSCWRPSLSGQQLGPYLKSVYLTHKISWTVYKRMLVFFGVEFKIFSLIKASNFTNFIVFWKIVKITATLLFHRLLGLLLLQYVISDKL